MIRKITLASVATMALLFIPAQAEEGMKCQAGKCGAGMMEKSSKSGEKCHKGKKGHKMYYKMGHSSPLLMHLPSPMRMIMKLENDPKLALTAEQKAKLEAQRKEMMPKMMKLKKEIAALSKEIKKACKKNVPAADQKERVEKLAKLKTEATMTKLTCIEGVKATLNKEQLGYLKELRKAKMAKMKAKMKGMKKEMSSKCGAQHKKDNTGKCASNK